MFQLYYAGAKDLSKPLSHKRTDFRMFQIIGEIIVTWWRQWHSCDIRGKSDDLRQFLRGRIRITLMRLTLKIPHNRSASKTIKVERKWNAIKVTGGKWIDRKSHLFANTIPSAATKFTNITKTALFISFLYLKTRFYFIVNIYLIFFK